MDSYWCSKCDGVLVRVASYYSKVQYGIEEAYVVVELFQGCACNSTEGGRF